MQLFARLLLSASGQAQSSYFMLIFAFMTIWSLLLPILTQFFIWRQQLAGTKTPNFPPQSSLLNVSSMPWRSPVPQG